MSRRTPLLTLLVLLTASLAFACSDDGGTQPLGLVGDTLTVSRTGDGISGSFVTDGVFDVRVVGDDVTVDNSRLIVFRLTPQGNGFRTAIVTGSGPKAVAEGVTQRPGPILDLTFDIGPGEYYVLLKTDSTNVWTMTVKGVSGPPGG
ncbi:MAG: hypothetical protein IIA90_05125 [Chloroflexi bacterium]|nr:hypothetical protein [Chloroflexota bacterium]